MSIVSMSHVEIVAPRARADQLLSTIQDQGSLQIEEVPLVVTGTRSFLHRDRLSAKQQDQYGKLQQILRVLSEIAPFFKGVRRPSREELAKALSQLPSDDADPMLLRASRVKRRADSLWRKRKNIAHDIEFLSRYYDKLEGLNSISKSDEFPTNAHYLAVVVPPTAQKQLSNIEKRLADEFHGSCRVLRPQSGRGRTDDVDVAVIAFPEECEGEVRRAVEYAGLSEFRPPGAAHKLPLMDAVKLLHDRLEALPERLAEIDDQIRSLKADNHAAVIATERICADSLARLDCIMAAAHSEFLFVLHAWVPTDDIDGLRDMLVQRVGPEVVVSVLAGAMADAGQIPVRLRNASVFKPFERLLKLLSDPLYGTVDPTPVMAIVFPLFFGLVLGDIGYGLLILAGSLWARRRWRHLELVRDITSIAWWCGITSVLFGLVYGELLGDFGERSGLFPLVVGGVKLVPLWQSRERIVDELLFVTIAIGCLHIALGLLLGIAEAIRMRSRRHLGERCGLLLGLAVGVFLLAPIQIQWLPDGGRLWIGLPVLFIGIIVLVISTGPAGLIELLGLLANVLSYSRLMALGVAGMVMAKLANVLAASQAHYLVSVLVGISIHSMAIVIAVVETTIHSLRLHYVEFLPKFFVRDGRSYAPLRRKGEERAS